MRNRRIDYGFSNTLHSPREALKQARLVFQQASLDTFLSRETQEPFPDEQRPAAPDEDEARAMPFALDQSEAFGKH